MKTACWLMERFGVPRHSRAILLRQREGALACGYGDRPWQRF
jgi:hypothetical protein